MKHIIKRAAGLSLVLLIAACSDQARFDNANEVDLNAPAPGVIDNALPQETPIDPASPAFFQQRVGDRVLFEVDQHTLTVEAQSILSAQATWLSQNPDYQARIEGHADEQGTTDYNLALSARRANAVKEFLASKGVDSSRLRTVPYGKERPAELCANESCYRLNRRAVTVIAGGAIS